MPFSRTDATIVRGPAIVQYNDVTFYSAGPIEVRTSYDLFEIPSSAFGPIDERIRQILTEVTFTPVGALSAAALAVLYPHTACAIGDSAMPATDETLVIHPTNGTEKLTYTSAFVSRMPTLMLGATKTAFGPVTFTCMGGDNEAWTDAAHLFTTASAAFADTSLAASGIKTVPYTGVLGALSAPWNAIYVKEGWEIAFEVGLEPDQVDDTGIYDYHYNGQARVTARCKPVGISVANLHALMNLQGAGITRGMSILNKKQALVISGGSGNITTTLNNVLLKTAPHNYHVGDRVEDLEFVSARNLTTGALDALFSVGLVS